MDPPALQERARPQESARGSDNRRPRTIVDYTFSKVSSETLHLTPAEAIQFGRALLRILQGIFDADPNYGPVHLSKVDIADGFHRVCIASIQPTSPSSELSSRLKPGAKPMVAFPTRLPMGWVDSASYFCAATETVADLANARLSSQLESSIAPTRHRRQHTAEL
jgi:hypothetical protein